MKNLNLINHIETAKSRLNNIHYHSLNSIADGKGNKLKVWREDKWIADEYPFTEDNISIVHNHLLFFLFSLDLRDEELQPSDFIESFAGGYKEGLKFLDNEGIFLNDIADQNRRKNLLEILKRIIHERNFKGNTLLKKVYDNLPLIWNERNIREYGKYHGIKTAIDRMVKRAGIDAKDLQKDGVKAEVKKHLEFKDFFNLKNISDNQIEVIQSKFKNSKGKEMAMLVYELSKRDLIEIIENSKMQGRKHFIQSLNKNIKRETGINYYLRQGANGLELNNTNEKDDYYKNVSNEISEILK